MPAGTARQIVTDMLAFNQPPRLNMVRTRAGSGGVGPRGRRAACCRLVAAESLHCHWSAALPSSPLQQPSSPDDSAVQVCALQAACIAAAAVPVAPSLRSAPS